MSHVLSLTCAVTFMSLLFKARGFRVTVNEQENWKFCEYSSGDERLTLLSPALCPSHKPPGCSFVIWSQPDSHWCRPRLCSTQLAFWEDRAVQNGRSVLSRGGRFPWNRDTWWQSQWKIIPITSSKMPPIKENILILSSPDYSWHFCVRFNTGL